MLNINDLEARHRKYKLKQYIPYFIISVLFIVIAIVLFNYDNNNNNKIIYQEKNNKIDKNLLKIIKPIENNETKDLNITLPIEKEKIIIKVKDIPDIKPVKKERTTLSPSLNFMRELQPHDIYQYEDKEVENQNIIPEDSKVVTTNEEIVVDELPSITIKKKSSIKIKRNDPNDEISHVIKRFKVNNNPALSLFIAKKYYLSAQYHKSYNYALITNQINNNIEASWIIFAKSLMKLGEKDMAIKTLKKYIDHSHSSQAKILLDEINSGKFK